MNVWMRMVVLFVFGGASILNAQLEASPPQTTTVHVKKLCPSCGKKIVQKLTETPGVLEASMNVDERIIVIRCKPGVTVSARGVWETVERGGEQPTKLAGPSGIFTTKPKR